MFDQYQLAVSLDPPKSVALGSGDSLWRVVARPERISTGEFLFTLKARHSFAILPEVDPLRIPDAGRAKAIEELQKLADAASRDSPDAVIDRARSSAQWCLGTWAASRFDDSGLRVRDLVVRR